MQISQQHPPITLFVRLHKVPHVFSMASVLPRVLQPVRPKRHPERSTDWRRKRTIKACYPCQIRKIRCDVMEEGVPCTNCRQHRKECIVKEGKRERRRHQFLTQAPESSYRRSSETKIDTLANRNQINASTQLNTLNYEEEVRPTGSAFLKQQNEFQVCPDGVDPKTNLPNYIRHLPPWVSSTDFDYLWRKGALIIPETELRDALLHCFALFVHPFMPVIDLGGFFTIIENDDQTNTVSLMLFQVVMSAAIAYVDIGLLNKHGYNSMREARENFFNRANLLYSLECETDKVTVLQTVILMTLWSESPNNTNDSRYFIGIAISLAQEIDRESMTGISQGLWKRILWTCYMRDRIAAISFQGPMIIRDEAFHIPQLELEDFDIASWMKHVNWISRRNGDYCRNSSIHTLARMGVALAECCRCISQCDEELETWYKTLPRDLQWSKKPLPREMSSSYNNALIIHRAILNGVYLAARNSSCRTQLADANENPQIKLYLELRIQKASMSIIAIFYQLDVSGFMTCMSDIGVPILQSTIATWLMGVKSLYQQTREFSNTCFKVCMDILQQLRDVYSLADTVSFSAAAAVHRLGLSTEVGPAARTGRSINVSANVPMVVKNPNTTADAAIPTFLSPTPKVNHQLEYLTTRDPLTPILSVTMTSQERELLIQLSSPPVSTDSIADRKNSPSSPQTHETEGFPTCHHNHKECSNIENKVEEEK